MNGRDSLNRDIGAVLPDAAGESREKAAPNFPMRDNKMFSLQSPPGRRLFCSGKQARAGDESSPARRYPAIPHNNGPVFRTVFFVVIFSAVIRRPIVRSPVQLVN